MRSRRRWLALLLLLAARPLAAQPVSQLPEPGEHLYRSQNRQYLKDRCPLGLDFQNRRYVCVTPSASGGGNTVSLTFSATVTTEPGQASVATSTALPEGSTVEECIGTTVSDVAGGYHLGIAGAPKLYGAHLSGTTGASSAGSVHVAANPHRLYADEPVVVTAPDGAFSNVGTVAITCTYQGPPS